MKRVTNTKQTEEVANLADVLREYNQTLSNLEVVQKAMKEAEEKLEKSNQEFLYCETKIAWKKEEIVEIEKNVAERNTYLSGIQVEVMKAEERLKELVEVSNEIRQDILDGEKEKTFELKKCATEVMKRKADCDKEIVFLTQQVEEQQSLLDIKIRRLSEAEKNVESENDKLIKIKSAIIEAENSLKILEISIEDKNNKLAKISQEITMKETKKQELTSELGELETKVANLKNENKEQEEKLNNQKIQLLSLGKRENRLNALIPKIKEYYRKVGLEIDL